MTQFLGDRPGYRRFVADNWAPTPWWCPRHWEPAAVEGRDGVAASMILSELVTRDIMPIEVMAAPPKIKNYWLEKTGIEKPMCCRLGEEKMHELWAEAGYELEGGSK